MKSIRIICFSIALLILIAAFLVGCTPSTPSKIFSKTEALPAKNTPSVETKVPIYTFTPRFQETRSWKYVGLAGIRVEGLLIDFKTPSTLYGLSLGYIHKSTDSGVNWDKYSPDTFGLICMTMDPKNNYVLYVQGYTGLYKSEDGFVRWENIGRAVMFHKIIVDPVNPDILYGLPDEDGIYKSTDAGKSWKPLNDGLLTEERLTFAVTDLAVNPLDTSILYIIDQYGTHKSVDGGATWKENQNGLVYDFEPDRILAGDDLDALIMEPGSPDTLYIGSHLGRIFKTTDGGESWVENYKNIPQGDYSQPFKVMAFDTSSPPVLYIASEAGVFLTRDGGTSWIAVSSGLPKGKAISALVVDPLTPTRVYAAVEDSGVFVLV